MRGTPTCATSTGMRHFTPRNIETLAAPIWSGSGNNWYLISDVAFDQCYDDNTNCNQQPDFVPLDFNGFADVTVTLGPEAGQLNIQGSTPLPPQLDFDWNPIVFGGGVPVGGWSHLTLRQDGTYTFSGHFHDLGALEYNMALVWGVQAGQNGNLYTFEHRGHVSGTFNPVLVTTTGP